MKPSRIALTGGIATGKSTVACMFEKLGAVILDADRFARDVVQPGSECSRRLFQVIGPDYFDQDGELKRRELRERIIEDEQLRGQVSSILHPSIMDAMEAAWKTQQESSEGQRTVIFDIPLLFEARLQERFDLVILVYVPRSVQIARLMDRDGLSAAQAESTLSMQWPIDAKSALSHLIIDNSGSLETTQRQVALVWKQVAGKAQEIPTFRAPSGS